MDEETSASRRQYYRLTDAQVMLLWEEAFSSGRQATLPSNLLYFEMIIPNGDVQALNKAFNKVIETNDSLRLQLGRLSLSKWKEARDDYQYINILPYRLWLNRLRQSIADFQYLELPVVELADERAYEIHLEKFRAKSKKLMGGALFDAELVRFGPESIALIARFHHITIDGYSFKLLFERIAEYYEQYRQGVEPVPAVYSIVKYLETDEQYRNSKRFAKDFAFWKKAFTTQPRYSFPAGKTPVKSGNLTLEKSISGELYQKCVTMTQGLGVGCSTYSLLMFIAAFTVYRVTGQTNFAIFHMSHGRSDAASKQVIGAMMNMIPIFFNLTVTRSFIQEMQTCKIAYLDSLMHSRLSFNELMKFYFHEGIRHGFNFNHAWMVFSSEDFASSVNLYPLVKAKTYGSPNQPHQFFGEFQEIRSAEMHLSLRFQTVKYSAEQVNTYLNEYLDTLKQVVQQPDAPLSSLRQQALQPTRP